MKMFNLLASFLLFQVAVWNSVDGSGQDSLIKDINEDIDVIFANLRHQILERDLDAIILPSDSDNFTATLFNSVLDGMVWIGDGRISGFSTVHRTGNISVETRPARGEVIITGAAGLTDLEGKYSTRYSIGPFRHKFGVSFKISFVSLELVTKVSVLQRAISLEGCDLVELSTLQVTLHGVGIFDTVVYNMVVNAVTQLLEPVIRNEASRIVCSLLESVFDSS